MQFLFKGKPLHNNSVVQFIIQFVSSRSAMKSSLMVLLVHEIKDEAILNFNTPYKVSLN